MSRRYTKTIPAIVSLVLALVYFFHDRELTGAPSTAKVVEVHDGDTVSVLFKGVREKVRLAGIDAPELGQGMWGGRAKRHLEKLLDSAGWIVNLEFDIEKRDKYGRLLAYLWTSDKKLLNLEMLKDGYAVLFTFPPNVKHTAAFREAQRAAREKRLGIWGRKGIKQFPEDYRREHPR